LFNKYTHWTEIQDLFLKEHYSQKGVVWCSKKLKLTLISTEYPGCMNYVKVKCDDCGDLNEIIPASINRSVKKNKTKLCPNCAGVKKFTIADLNNKIAYLGFFIPDQEYLNSHKTKLKIIYPDKTIKTISWADFYYHILKGRIE
jgi:hypothetical protein